MDRSSSHITVLLEEAVSVLALEPSSVVFDCTLGEGGHARRILSELNSEGVYIGLDADEKAISDQGDLTKAEAKVCLLNRNFSDIKAVSEELKLTPDAILADLGWRTDQFEYGGKGFSFKNDEPLLMTFGDPEKQLFTARDIVNDWEEENIADVIYGYGEERFARRIAKAIIESRKQNAIETTSDLVKIIEEAIPNKAKGGKIHPATKTFQALRIAVNDELGVLKKLLNDGFEVLAPQGRMAIISFHSLEDRVVKQFFKEKVHDQQALRLIKKPIQPDLTEKQNNRRSRSAKLRVIEKI